MSNESTGMEPSHSFPLLSMSQNMQQVWAESYDCISTLYDGLTAVPLY